jgi:hypothetical protein
MKIALALMVCLAAAGANAQAVYRCGSTYSQEPCPQARLVDVSDPRSASQRADAMLLAANDKQRGDEMAHARTLGEGSGREACRETDPREACEARPRDEDQVVPALRTYP